MKRIQGLMLALSAFASASFAEVPAINADYTSAATSIATQINTILPIALGIGGSVVAVFLGWKLLRRFVK